MPRPLRSLSVLPDHPHHVVLRGNNRRNIFSYDSERWLFLRLLEAALHKTSCVLHNLALLTNHVHLLLTPPSVASFSACLKDLAQRYSIRRNRRRAASGKLFEQRFWCRAITSERQMAVASAYVDLNPQRARLRPRHLRWSTVGLHTAEQGASVIPADMVTTSGWYLGLGPSPSSRAHAYREWLALYLEHAARLHEAYHRVPASLDRADRRRFERPDRSSAR